VSFAATQYVRVPGAIEQKRNELASTPLTESDKEFLLNAGRFVESGFAWVQERFKSLKLMVLISTDQDFLTSDWPCFDFKDSDDAPLLGQEVGHHPGVVVCLPLTPRLLAIMFPSAFIGDSSSAVVPSPIAIAAHPSQVRNLNSLLVQQAVRFIVSSTEQDFVFKIARKRKRAGR